LYEEINSNVIEIEFHNTEKYKKEKIVDYFNTSMASLDEKGVLFANIGNEKINSSISYKEFETWASKNQWRINMEDKENVETIALTEEYVVASTMKNLVDYNVRFYKRTGSQEMILSYPGRVITMSGHLNKLIIIYYQSPKISVLSYQYWDMKNRKIIKSGVLPMTEESIITWTGFNSYGVKIKIKQEFPLSRFVWNNKSAKSRMGQ
jgi:chromosome transmission fidelity protein 4